MSTREAKLKVKVYMRTKVNFHIKIIKSIHTDHIYAATFQFTLKSRCKKINKI